jgi:hypothetical protein
MSDERLDRIEARLEALEAERVRDILTPTDSAVPEPADPPTEGPKVVGWVSALTARHGVRAGAVHDLHGADALQVTRHPVILQSDHEAEVGRVSDRLQEVSQEADRLKAENERLRDKALRFDLDVAGIESREADAVELVEARARIAELAAEQERLKEEVGDPLIDSLNEAIYVAGNDPDASAGMFVEVLEAAAARLRARVQPTRIAYEDEDGQERCQGCGTPVRVVSSDEGTSYYEPVEESRGEVQQRAWGRAMKRWGFKMNEANMEAVRDLAGVAFDAGRFHARVQPRRVREGEWSRAVQEAAVDLMQMRGGPGVPRTEEAIVALAAGARILGIEITPTEEDDG